MQLCSSGKVAISPGQKSECSRQRLGGLRLLAVPRAIRAGAPTNPLSKHWGSGWRWPGRLGSWLPPAATTGGEGPACTPPPTAPGSLPILEDLPKMDLRRAFMSHHQLLNEAGQRLLLVRYLGKRKLLLREPDDVAALLARPGEEAFRKHPRQQRVSAFLGAGLATQPDRALHAAQRDTLSPAFRPDYVRQLDGVMAAAAERLAEALLAAAAAEAEANAAAGSGSGGSSSGEGRAAVAMQVEMQDLLKRHSLDLLGLAALRSDMGALGRSPALAAAGGAAAARLPPVAAAAAPMPAQGKAAGVAKAAADAARTAAVAAVAAVEELVNGYVSPGELALLDAKLGGGGGAAVDKAAAARRAAAADAARSAALASAAAVEELVSGYTSGVSGSGQLALLEAEMEVAASAAAANGYAALGADVDLVRLMTEIEAASLWLLMALPVPNELLPGYGTYEANVRRLDELVYDMVRRRREAGVGEGDKDLLAFLLRAQREQQQAQAQEGGGAAPVAEINDKLIRDELVTMLLGGTDTSALTVAFAAWHLAAEPQLQAELRAEVLGVLGGRALGELRADDVKAMPLLTAVVNETLRLHPPLAEITRVATQDEQLGGYCVPAGSTAVACLYSMQRHPGIWPRPEEWLPARWLPASAGGLAEELGPKQPNAFLPFGVGSRSCIGRHFGLLSAQLTLAALVARLEVLPPAPPAGMELDWSQSIVITSRNGVWLRLRPVAGAGAGAAAR